MSVIEDRLAEKGLTLPEPAAPVASYVPYTVSGNLVFISGQLPFEKGKVIRGRLGETMNVADGILAAQSCALNLLAQAKAACEGDLDQLNGCLRLGGWVACTSTFLEHPQVINGASDLMLEAFGPTGRHARAAVGAPSLPLGAAVEIDAIFSLK